MIINNNFIYNSFVSDSPRNLYMTQYGWHKYSSGNAHVPSMKEHYILHIVVSGKGYYSVRNKKYLVQTGEAFLLIPAEKVDYYADPDDPWEYIWVGIYGNESESILKQFGFLNNDRLIVKLKSTEDVTKVMKQILNYEYYEEKNNLYLSGLFFLFLHAFQKNIEHVNDSSSVSTDLVNVAIRYIKENYNKEISISSMCKKLGVDRTNLFKLFKKKFNCSPQQYIIDFKLEIARTLLAETDDELKKVAVNSGFLNYAHFSRTFRNKFAKTPLEYRRVSRVLKYDNKS